MRRVVLQRLLTGWTNDLAVTVATVLGQLLFNMSGVAISCMWLGLLSRLAVPGTEPLVDLMYHALAMPPADWERCHCCCRDTARSPTAQPHAREVKPVRPPLL